MALLSSGGFMTLDTQVLIQGVPAYAWYRGCGPTAAGMVIGYWDGQGFDDLVPGSAATQTAAVDAMIASDGSFGDYGLPTDYYPNMQDDKSEIDPGSTHADDCVADFMKTSRSYNNNYWGWSWFTHMDDGLNGYVQHVAPHYESTATTRYWFTMGWEDFCAEIDAGRPVVLLVDTDGNGSTDHFVAAVGYGDQGGTPMYACHDTWDSSVHWYEWRGTGSGTTYGVYGAVFFSIAGSQPPTAPMGTPEWWLAEHGLTNGTPAAEELIDHDGDGMAAWEEWVAGTSPTDASDRLAISSCARDGSGNMAVAWPTVTGRVYDVYRSEDLRGGWTAVAEIAGTGAPALYEDPAAGSTTAFFRLGVRLAQ